jgi:hypothetical protein
MRIKKFFRAFCSIFFIFLLVVQGLGQCRFGPWGVVCIPPPPGPVVTFIRYPIPQSGPLGILHNPFRTPGKTVKPAPTILDLYTPQSGFPFGEKEKAILSPIDNSWILTPVNTWPTSLTLKNLEDCTTPPTRPVRRVKRN